MTSTADRDQRILETYQRMGDEGSVAVVAEAFNVSKHTAKAAMQRARRKKSMVNWLNRDELLIPATRYYMGRMTIATCMHAQALAEQWGTLPQNVKDIIKRDLQEAFAFDDAERAQERKYHICALGSATDRNAWELVREAWRREELETK